MKKSKKKRGHSKLHKEVLNTSRIELIKNIIWILLILGIFYVSIQVIGTDNIKDKVAQAGIFGPIIFIALKASTIVFAPLGGTPLYLAAGTLFGFTKGILYIMIGDFIGFTISFYISRIFGKKVASHFLSGKGMEAVSDVINHMGTTKGLIQSCLVFIGIPEVVSYGAGLTKIPYKKFILPVVLIEIIPVAILIAAGEFLFGVAGKTAIIWINIVVGAIIIFGVFWLRKQAKKDKKTKLFSYDW